MKDSAPWSKYYMGVKQSVMSSKELWLRLYNNRALRKLLRKGLLDLCSATNIIWVIPRMRLVGLVEMYGGEMKYIQDFIEKTSRKETTGKTYA
jgi:hypothetical protein